MPPPHTIGIRAIHEPIIGNCIRNLIYLSESHASILLFPLGVRISRGKQFTCAPSPHLPVPGVTRTMIYLFCRIYSILWYTADTHTSGRSTWLHNEQKIEEDAVVYLPRPGVWRPHTPFGTILADCVFNLIESTCLLNLDRVLLIDAMRSRTVWVQYHHCFEWNRQTCMRTMAILIIYVNILNADLYRSNLRFFHSIADFLSLFFFLRALLVSCVIVKSRKSLAIQRNRLCRILMKRPHRHALLVR